MTVALLDGDIIAFKASASAEDDIDWGDGLEGKTVSPEQAVDAAMTLVEEWTKKARCDTPVICFSDRSIPQASFRYSIHPLYKRNRTGEKPEMYKRVVEVLEEEYRCITIPRLEADDVMGIYATNGEFDDPVVVSDDKDMQTIPARILLPRSMQRPQRITPKQANYHWMFQTLVGDSIDNYKGCPGIGEKTAAKILAEADSGYWKAVVAAFKAKGRTITDAITEARVARILRAEDYRPSTQEIRLWHPSEPTWVKLDKIPT